MILRIFLIFQQLEPGDSYKKDSNKKCLILPLYSSESQSISLYAYAKMKHARHRKEVEILKNCIQIIELAKSSHYFLRKETGMPVYLYIAKSG